MTVYLVAGKKLDELFGFEGDSPSKGEINQHKRYISEVMLEKEELRVGEVLVVGSRSQRKVGRVDLSPDKGLEFDNYFYLRDGIVVRRGSYMKNLGDYVLEESEDSRIVVARLVIAPAVKGDLEKITEDVRARIWEWM